MASTRLYLVRHGATPMTADDRFSGMEGALSGEGRRQILRLAERLRGEGISALYSSPMARALESAEIIGAAIGLKPAVRDALREISHGHWEGRTHAEAEKLFPAEYAAWEEDPFEKGPVGGESGADVLRRARPALDEIVEAHPGERLAVVSHKATVRLLVCDLIGIAPRGYRSKLEQSPGSLNVIDVLPSGPARLSLFNG